MNEKYSIMSPFDITSKMLGPYLFSATARETLGDKMELYFQDHSFIPLFIQVGYSWLVPYFLVLNVVQENYLKTQPAKLRNLDGPDKVLRELQLMDKAAASISDGDLVDGLIHGLVMNRHSAISSDMWALQTGTTLVTDATSRCVLSCATSIFPLRSRGSLWRFESHVFSTVWLRSLSFVGYMH